MAESDFSKGNAAFAAGPGAMFAEMTKRFSELRFPAMIPDNSALLAAHKRNMEVLSNANRLALEGAQAVAKRHMEIMQQTMTEFTEHARELTHAESPQAKAARQAELVKKSYERAVANIKDLSDLIQRSNAEALGVLSHRFTEAMDEVKLLLEKAEHPNPDETGKAAARSYAVKEIFLTLQGEGAQAGHAAVFCRFAGCNLWSGLERDRTAAICRFCDTDFVGLDGSGGGRFADADLLAEAILAEWSGGDDHRLVVLTGGEPLLQVDAALIAALHARHFRVAVETNGTRPAPDGLDWICVSPKAGAPLVLRRGQELKLVFPQAGAEPERFEGLDFAHFMLQPMDGPLVAENTRHAVAYCLAHPRWRLSSQTHKALGLR